MTATPQQIVDALTRDQVRQVALAFVESVFKLDAGGGVAEFVHDLQGAAGMAERFALEVPA